MTLAQIGESLREILATVKGSPVLATEITSLKSEVSDLKTKLAASDSRVTELTNEKAASETAITAAKAEAEASKLAAETAKSAATAAEKKAQELIDNPSKVAMEIAAKAGVKPQDRPAAESGKDEPKLTGRARVEAAFRKQNAK